MTKAQYHIEINGRTRRVVVERAAGMLLVDIDGTTRTVSAERVDGHTLSLLVQDLDRTASYEVTVAPNGTAGQLGVSLGVATVAVSLGERRRRGSRGGVGGSGRTSGEAVGGVERIMAPMPGKIVRVLVTPGATVRAGQPVIVVEAMKMENELRAAADGVVKEVLVNDGQSVDAGGLLVVIVGNAGHAGHEN